MVKNREYPQYEVVRAVEIKKLVSFFCHIYQPGFVFKGESHDFWELAIVLDGKAVICAGDKVLRLKKGQAVWHRPGEFHSVRTEGDSSLQLGVISFCGSVMPDVSGKPYFVRKNLMDMFIRLRMEAGKVYDFHGIEGERPILIKKLKPKRELEQQMIISRLEYLFAALISGGSVQEERRPSSSEEDYLKIIEIISSNISKRLSIEEIAEKCHMSASNAKRVFSKYAGCGILEYYNGVIIMEAKKLLSDGLSINDVSSVLGFCSQNYFSSFFKRITGISPSRWKADLLK